jgi:S1-C subfamily serine protease
MSILSHSHARSVAVALALGLAAPALLAASASAVRESVVKVYSTTQRTDYTQPWQSGSPGGGHGSAFIIGKRRILTNAHVVSDSRFLEVQREGSPRRYEARVLFAGHDCDLAVLTVDDPSFFEGTRPLEFGRLLPDLNNEVIVVGYPMGGVRISLTRGVVSRIDYSPYSHSGVDSHLVLQVDAAINPGNSGGPVLFGGRVVGLAFQGLASSQNIGYAIPLPVIEHFLTDIEDGRYDGYPELGIAHTDTRNPALRAALGLADGDGGVAVVYLDPFGAAAGHLQLRDVILDVDGYPVADDGSIRIGGNTVEYTELVERRQWGATMRFTVLRAGRRETLAIPLTNRPDPFIFRYAYDTPPDYLIVGGLVFSPLSRGYLATLGAELSTPAAQHLHYYTQYAKPDNLYTNRQQFVVLVTRLPHPINTYHEAFLQGVVRAVNGQPVGHLADLESALATPTNGFHLIEFDGMPNRLVLDAKAAAEADREIAARYAIPAPSRITPPASHETKP